MTTTIKLALCQYDFFVGDIEGNCRRILAAAATARAEGADMLVCPELALTGYPPEDLLFHSGFRRQVDRSLKALCAATPGIDLLVGYPEYEAGDIYNAAALLRGGRIFALHRKQCLPNYRVFDEKRYFRAGVAPTLIDVNGVRAALLVCEDLWEEEPALQALAAGASLLIVINASPYSIGKIEERERVARARVAATGLSLVYLNLVGGQDELVFDGQSFVMDARGQVTTRLAAFTEQLHLVTLEVAPGGRVEPLAGPVVELSSVEESAYGALVCGVRDYVTKHRFAGVVMGLSGGVDSALTAAIAVDALGASRVHAVMMPSRYTSDISLKDAEAQARTLGIRYSVIPIEPMFKATLEALSQEFQGCRPDTTEENIQSRCRGLLLMAISNKTGAMLLTTGNKSEMAVGYATLYGDMAGGFAPIKDCSKLLVYRLAHYRNALSRVIPERVITRAPSAELREGQADTDSLPPYDVLDPILEAFIEEDLSVDEIVARGFERATVGRVLAMVKACEYKRRQSPPGVRISERAFGRDWRYPITSGYRPQ
jgi:NAD+ synthase (glutamine-hydrolysing)